MAIKPLTGQDRDFLRVVLPAARTGKLDAVAAYLEADPTFLRRIGPHGRTMLWEAARNGKVEMVEMLAERGADIEALGCYYRETRVELSPWCVAVVRGKTRVVDALVERGARFDLISACFLNDVERFEAILADDRAAATREVCREHRWHPYSACPLEYAVAAGHAPLVERLFECGATIPPDDAVLFRWATEDGNREIVEMLIEHGVDPRKHDEKDWARNPVWRDLAARFGVAPTIDTPNRLGFPPLVEACRGNHNAPDDPARVQPLLDRGAGINVRDYKGKTALHRASQAGFTKVGALLIDGGADIEATDEKNETPLFDAVRAGRSAMVEFLLDRGADPNACNKLGQRAADIAKRTKTRDSDGVRRALAKRPATR